MTAATVLLVRSFV